MTTPAASRGLGYRPDPIDARDQLFGARKAGTARVVEVRFDDHVHGIRDQRNTNSCVGHSGRGAVELRRALDGHPHRALSALGLYWPARAVNGYQNEDGGAFIRSAMRVAHRLGLPSEAAWPFDPFRVNERPSIGAEVDGLVRADGVYERIPGTGIARAEAALDALQARCPVVFGTLITAALAYHTGAETLPAPGTNDEILGGHAMYLAGFDRGGERVRVVNSYGRSWGDLGMAWLAAEWLAADGTADVWALRPSQAVIHA